MNAMKMPTVRLALVLMGLGVLLVQTQCLLIPDDRVTGHPVANQRPKVRITGGAMVPDSSGVDYKVNFQWVGSDDDGVVVLYQVATDDTVSERAWRDTTGFSSQFLFRASTMRADNHNEFSDWHTFYIRAIDNEFSVSAADKRYFNALTIAPTSSITFPKLRVNQKETQTIFVSWDGEDLDSSKQERRPVFFEYKLVNTINDNEGIETLRDSLYNGIDLLLPKGYTGARTDWIRVLSSVTGIKLSELPTSPPAYAFAVRAVDEAGAVEPALDLNRNVLNFGVTSDPSRPRVTITEQSVGYHVFPSMGSEWDVDVPAQKPLRFKWTGDASDYGSLPGNSNYALDVSDPENQNVLDPRGIGGWTGWGGWKGNQVPFVFGPEEAGRTHYLYVYMRDISDAEASTQRCVIKMNVVGFTHDRFALLVDDNRVVPGSGQTTGDQFDDAYVDSTILRSLHDYGTVDVFDIHGRNDISPNAALIPLSKIARYQNIIWNFGDLNSPTGLKVNETDHSRLSSFVTSGGRLFLFGGRLAGAFRDYHDYANWPAPLSNQSDLLNNFFFKFMQYRSQVVAWGADSNCPRADNLIAARSLNPAYPDLFLDRHKWNPYNKDSNGEYYGGIIHWEGYRLGKNAEPPTLNGVDSLYKAECWTHSVYPSCEGQEGSGQGCICGTRVVSTRADTLAAAQHGRIIMFNFEPWYLQSDLVRNAGNAAVNWLLNGRDF